MRTFRLGRPSPALVVSIIALVVALGGTSYAAFSVPRNSVGSRQLRRNAVTTSKLRDGAVTGAKIAKDTITAKQINISALGTVPSAASANQAANADALQGSPASAFQNKILWARIAPDGTLTTGSGAVSSGLLTQGEYEVIFNRPVTGCAYEATIGSSLVTNSDVVDDLQKPMMIRTEPRTGNADGVFVAIYDGSQDTDKGDLEDDAFHLAVIC